MWRPNREFHPLLLWHINFKESQILYRSQVLFFIALLHYHPLSIMSCVKFTRFTGDAKRHEPVEKVKTLHVADFNVCTIMTSQQALTVFTLLQSLKRLLHTYYEKTEAEFELHLHYENDTRCNGESEISPRLWNALTNIREASPPTSDFPIYYVCFKKHQSESNTNSNNNGRSMPLEVTTQIGLTHIIGKDKPPFMEPSIKGSPMQDVRGETLPENDCISLQPSSEKCDARPVRNDPTSSSSSREGGGSKKRTWGQGIPERPAKSSRPTPSALVLPQTLEDKLTGLPGPDDKRCRVVVGVDLDSGCAVWAARNTLGRVYLRRSAFDMQGNLLSDDEGTKAQRVEDTEFSQIRGDSAQSSWDAVKILIESRLDALETVSPRRQLARAQSAVPSTPVRPSQAAVKDGAKTAPARERRRNQTSPSVSPSQRRPQSVHTKRSAGSEADSTSDDDEQSSWEPSGKDAIPASNTTSSED